jgi:hypothetical protein
MTTLLVEEPTTNPSPAIRDLENNPPANFVNRTFPPFSLSRLLRTVFHPKGGERICVLIDLRRPEEIADLAFLNDPTYTIQRHAYHDIYRALHNGVMGELGLTGGDLYAYAITGGSNLDLPETAVSFNGETVALAEAVYTKYDIIICVSTYSATAPLTAFAKEYGFRGATMHGMNEIILRSGLAVDYDVVSMEAERMRLGLTGADAVELDFMLDSRRASLRIELAGQEAQKSHGLCRGGPDVANLPAGEIYFVPTGAEGTLFHRYEDGTLAEWTVTGGRVVRAEWLSGNADTVAAHKSKLANDPVTGELGELGFGTQRLPVCGRDIQDEKILGTIHVATGRSDHLGGHLTPDRFANKMNATHDDILFSPTKTPEILLPEVRMHRNGETVVLIEHYSPAAYLRALVD